MFCASKVEIAALVILEQSGRMVGCIMIVAASPAATPWPNARSSGLKSISSASMVSFKRFDACCESAYVNAIFPSALSCWALVVMWALPRSEHSNILGKQGYGDTHLVTWNEHSCSPLWTSAWRRSCLEQGSHTWARVWKLCPFHRHWGRSAEGCSHRRCSHRTEVMLESTHVLACGELSRGHGPLKKSLGDVHGTINGC